MSVLFSAFCQAQPLRPTNDPYVKNLRQLSEPPQDKTVKTKLKTQDVDIATSAVKKDGRDKKHEGEPFAAGEVVAIVGGQPILVGDMLLEINQLFEKHMPGANKEIRNREMPNAVKALTQKYVDAKLLFIDTVRKLPESADVDKIMEEAAKEFDNSALPKIMEKAGAKSPNEYDAALRSKGSSLRQMRENWAREQLVSYFVMQNLKFEKDITHEQLLKYYQDHLADYHQPSRARWEELMVRFDKYPNRDAAFEALVKMGNEVVYGAKLEAVAKRASNGITAADGGQHDWVTKGSIAAENLDKAIFSLPLNELSEMIETKLGVHIIRVLEREMEHNRPFVDVQSEIKEKLVQENRSKAIEDYIAKLREEIPVEIIREAN
jgi:PPIC-type PPIASE domain